MIELLSNLTCFSVSVHTSKCKLLIKCIIGCVVLLISMTTRNKLHGYLITTIMTLASSTK